jgi:hypothetical protein
MRTLLNKIICKIFGCKCNERIVLRLTKTDWDVSFLMYKKCDRCKVPRNSYKREHIQNVTTAIYGDMIVGKDWRAIVMDGEKTLLDTTDPNRFKEEMVKLMEQMYE